MIIPLKKHFKLHITNTHVVKKRLFVWLNMNHCLPARLQLYSPRVGGGRPQGIRCFSYFSFTLRFPTSLIQTVTWVLQVLETEHWWEGYLRHLMHTICRKSLWCLCKLLIWERHSKPSTASTPNDLNKNRTSHGQCLHPCPIWCKQRL